MGLSGPVIFVHEHVAVNYPSENFGEQLPPNSHVVVFVRQGTPRSTKPFAPSAGNPGAKSATRLLGAGGRQLPPKVLEPPEETPAEAKSPDPSGGYEERE